MAKLKKNKEAEAIAKIDEQVAEVKAEAKEKNVTKAEAEAIIAQQEKEELAGASTEKLKRATALLSGKFNLDNSYHVTNFKDGGKVVNLTLENKDFVVTVQIKDSERQGLAFE